MNTMKSLLLTAAAVAALSTLALAEPPAKDSAAPAVTTTTTQTTEAAKTSCHMDQTAAKKDGAMDMSKGDKAAMPMAGGCCSMTK
ncbi:hypothetical protein BH09VER1_BH09VER1_43730 [soil metagenome]